jgi:hypothetical protein
MTSRRRWPLALSTLALPVAAATLFLAPWVPDRPEELRDGWIVWTEPSSDEVAAIADATGMSERGRRVYLASTPEIESTESFNEHCAVEGQVVLGCYVDREIYLFAVTDERLAGTVESTAAHEMLHAAYERLSRAEREEVDALVADFVASIPEDHRVFADLEGYPAEALPDEWHSRLGTEFADLPPALEAHYALYFDDRAKVLDLQERSIAAFVELEAQIDALITEIDALDLALDARSAAYDAAFAALEADIASFNARADRPDGFASQGQFDRERAALVARSDALDAESVAINGEVERYNALVAELEALDADYADLYESLDSTDAPADPPVE